MAISTEKRSGSLGDRQLTLRDEIPVVLPQRGLLRVEAAQVLLSDRQFILLVRDQISAPSNSRLLFRLCSISFAGGLPREILQMDPKILTSMSGECGALLAAGKEDRAFLLGSALWWASKDWSFEAMGTVHSEGAHEVTPLSAAMTSEGLYLAYASQGKEMAKVVQLHRPGHFRRSFGEMGSDLLRLHGGAGEVMATDVFRLIRFNEEGVQKERDFSSYFSGEYLGRELVERGMDGSLLLSNGKHLLRLNSETLDVLEEGRLPDLAVTLWETEEGISTVVMDEKLGMIKIRRYGV